MRKLIAALLIATAPVIAFPGATLLSAAQAATRSDLGDLTTLSAIANDTLALVHGGDLVAAEKRVTDFESAWDQAAGDMQPRSPSQWQAVDLAADGAIGSLRLANPNQADAEAALNALIAQLDNPGAGLPAAAAPAALAIDLAGSGLVITNADGSPLPCEVALKTVRDASGSKTATDQAGYDAAMAKGLERCNADDDKRADGFFADAFALLG